MPRKICAAGLHDERVSSYAERVSYLLTTPAIDDIIEHEIKELYSYIKALEVFAAFYEKRLDNKALRCGIVHEERRFKWLFAEG